MTRLPIALDAMGGDFAPRAVVCGAAQAAAAMGVPIALVGREEAIRAELATCPAPEGLISIVDAPDVIAMEEPPSIALRRKPKASVAVAAGLVREGAACAMISAGNSGAAVGAALLGLGTLPGIRRPAIATVAGGLRDKVVLLDVGANSDCTAKHLVQYAVMGSVYAQHVLHLAEPRVGLLSIGEEPSKGNALIKAAHKMLHGAGIRFIGNVEGNDIFKGRADVVVCDGFVGNVALKLAEGFGEVFMSWVVDAFERHDHAGASREKVDEVFSDLRRQLDYAEYGGAALLGVNGVCIIGHGRSSPKAIVSAVRVASQLVAEGVVEQIGGSLRRKAAAPAEAHDAGDVEEA